MDKLQRLIKEDCLKIVISFILSCINMYLVVSLEMWTKSASRMAVAAFVVAGVALGSVLTVSFLQQQEKRLKVHALLWGLILAGAYVLGCRMRRDGTALQNLGNLPALLARIACLAVSAAAFVSLLLRGGICRGILYRSSDSKLPPAEKRKKYQAWQVGLFYGGLIFLCWLPVFLAYYPSVFAYDAEGQLYQVIAHDYSTHHPLLHTLFLGSFFRLGGNLLGSYQTGMAVHSIVQMMMMAGAFGYTLSYLYRKEVSVYLRLALFLFYAVFPTNSILALSTTKDVLFSALVLLYTLSVYQMADDATFAGKQQITYVFWTVLLLLFRNNAVYAFILSVPILCLGLHRMRGAGSGLWRRYLVCAVAALVLFGVCHAALKAATGAHSGSPREMLSVPLQQMARTRVEAEETLSPEMREVLDRYLPSEWVFAAYDPYLADPVKNRAVIHDDPAGLIKTWIRLGMEHPQIYIDAFLDNSIGYWFLEDRTHAQIYGIGTETGFGYLSTDNRTMPAGCEIEGHSYLPGLRAGMERIVSDNIYQKVPLLRVIFAPAFYWWMLCMYIAVAVYRRRYRLLLPVVFMVIYYMTLLLSPTVLVRYMYPFIVTVPTICCCLTKELDNPGRENIQ